MIASVSISEPEGWITAKIASASVRLTSKISAIESIYQGFYLACMAVLRE